ncbi:MAG: type II toxin-antitoxin system RelE/ParE family toxin [Cyanobacteriota bacterium]|nr:type II toxin-antitoxin system RelE/ParE family toxin [Cyanobacteriota bacterium]
MSRVEWLPQSLNDLKRHFDFLTSKNSVAAHQAAQKILQAGFSLENFPNRGTRLGNREQERNLRVNFGKYGYAIIYRVEEDTVFIVRVYHGREAQP